MNIASLIYAAINFASKLFTSNKAARIIKQQQEIAELTAMLADCKSALRKQKEEMERDMKLAEIRCKSKISELKDNADNEVVVGGRSISG
jgi:hypothetical protein